MKVEKIEYQRVFNLGNYDNMRLGVSITLEDGEHAMDAWIEAVSQVSSQYAAIRAQDRANEQAEKDARKPWRVTPEMVADAPTLAEKARKALELQREHDGAGEIAEAASAALEKFGVEVEFQKQPEGSIVGVSGDMTLTYRGSSFAITIPVKGRDEPEMFYHVHSLEELGRYIAQAERSQAGAEPIPF